MLEDFILSNRNAIIARARERVRSRSSPAPSYAEITHGIPVFLDQLGDALRRARTSDTIDHAQLSKSAGQHGQDLLRQGLTVAQVVHDYGDICQVITGLAVEQKEVIAAEEFRTLNLCLDDAIADAVTEFGRQRERAIEERGTERLGYLAHEMRNLLGTALLSFDMISKGQVAAGGSTGAMHRRSLLGLSDLIARSLTHVRLEAGLENLASIPVAELLEEIEMAALIQAEAHGLHMRVNAVDRTMTIEGDRQIVAGAISNLLHNAFKFTPKGGHVSLTTRTTEGRVLFEVEDECGGLPPGKAEELFLPYSQRNDDRSGVGLGLSISLRAAKAHGGELRVRDLPGKGCIFTLDLPRKPPPSLSLVREETPGAGTPTAVVGAAVKGSRTHEA